MSTALFLLLFFLLATLPHLSHANPLCTPSSCGVIRNISYPFRLKGDPSHCGHLILTCYHNLTSISLVPQNYYIKAINYQNSTIRVADASLNNHNICSFPISSAYEYYYFRDDAGYNFESPYSANLHDYYKATYINMMSCPNPLNNSSLFTNISTNCSRINNRYSYIKVGHMNASELPHMCGLDLIARTSWEFRDLINVSLSEIHHSLLYGFELNFCSDCEPYSSPSFWLELLLRPLPLLILGVICAVLSPPIFTIIGIAVLSMGLLRTYVLYYGIITPHSYDFVSAHVGIGLVIGVLWAVISPLIFILLGIAALSMCLLQTFVSCYNIIIPPRYGFLQFNLLNWEAWN